MLISDFVVASAQLSNRLVMLVQERYVALSSLADDSRIHYTQLLHALFGEATTCNGDLRVRDHSSDYDLPMSAYETRLIYQTEPLCATFQEAYAC